MSDGLSKVRMTLPQQTIGALDRIAVEIRLHNSKSLSRGDIIHALIEAVLRSRVDLSEAASVEEIRDLLGNGAWRA
jgi:hypothetical protein